MLGEANVAGWDPRDPQGHIAHEFDMIDMNKDGFLSPDELFEGLCKRGWEQDELQTLFGKLDTDGDGRISKTEYLAGMTVGTNREEALEFEHGLRRMGVNRPENIKALKEQWASANQTLAPMKVVRFRDLEKHGKLPRSSDGMTIPLSEVKEDEHIVFCSHNWKRGDEEQCKKNGHVWEGAAHPDDEKATKHKLLCVGVAKLTEEKGWELDKVHVWLDFCGIDQDDNDKKWAGVESLRGYLSVCDAVIIPYPKPPSAGASRSVDVLEVYGERGWTRLEALVEYCVGILKGSLAPELWVTWQDGREEGPSGMRLERFEFSLDPDLLPASETSILKSEADRPAIKVHQDKLLEEMRATVERQGYITRHRSEVSCVAFHPTNSRIVASCSSGFGGQEGKIRIVNRDTGTDKGNIDDVPSEYNCVAFSTDGKYLASSSEDNEMFKVWDAQSFTLKGCCEGHSRAVFCLAFSPDGMLLASGSLDKTVRLWDANTLVLLSTLEGHRSEIKSLSWAPDGKHLASGGDDRVVNFWDVEKLEASGVFKTDTYNIEDIAWSTDGNYLALAEVSGPVQVWDASSFQLKHTLEGLSEFFVVRWSPDGKHLAAGGMDWSIRVWDAATFELKHTITSHWQYVKALSFSSDGKYLASGSDDRTVKVWDAVTFDIKDDGLNHDTSPDGVMCVEFSPDGKLLATEHGGRFKVWDAVTFKLLHDLHLFPEEWPQFDEETLARFKALAQRTAKGTSCEEVVLHPSGDFSLTKSENVVTVNRISAGDGPDGKHVPIASFRSPFSEVGCMTCWGTTVVLGSNEDPKPLFLDAPAMRSSTVK